jgi:hypothetical protein
VKCIWAINAPPVTHKGIGMKFIVIGLAFFMAVMGCAKSENQRPKKGIWPFNIEKKAKPDLVIPLKIDQRPMVANITKLVVEPMQDGIVLRVTATADTVGWWDAALVEELSQDGKLSYSFRGIPPQANMTSASRTSSRQQSSITAAVFISAAQMKKATKIIVAARDNKKSISINF